MRLRSYLGALALWSLAGAGVAGGVGNTSTAGRDAGVWLPSGIEVYLQEMLWDRGVGLVYRFRFVSKDFKGVNDFDLVMADLKFLCGDYALPRLAKTGPQPNQVIISLADRQSKFGVYDPEVTQVFEAYVIENDTCIWEVY